MGKQIPSSLPDEGKIEDLLTKVRPVPSERFHQKTEQAAWRTEEQQPAGRNNLRRNLAFAILTLGALIVFLVSPQGRAWAQEVMRFFRRISSITVQLQDQQLRQIDEMSDPYDLPLVRVFIPPVSPEMKAIRGCETPQKSQSYHCQVALAEAELGYDLKALPEKPKDWAFQSLSFDRGSQSAVMSYQSDVRRISGISYSSLVLMQGMGKFPNPEADNPWDAVPANKLEPVTVAGYQGAYVKGGFALEPGHVALTWFEDDRQRLAWSEGARWYSLDFRPNPNAAHTMGKDQLIRLAESLVASPIASTEQLDPAYLTSISDAEKISGLDLQAPTLLPVNVNFSYARYSSSKQQVHLVYGENEELTIQEWKGNFIKPLGNYEIVHVNGEVAYYDAAEGSESHLFLWWHKDRLNYQLDYQQSFGWHIDKGKMISIAESMQDVNDFRKGIGGEYEQIALYEQALGINVREFSEVPAGWVFAGLRTDLYAQCIDLIYTATAGQGTLFIDQCKTDKHADASTIPLGSMEQVRVGKAKAQYVAGGFVVADNGKQVWDSTSLQKQLYWQEDRLWMRVVVYGDAALSSSKDDLISYAESLK